MVCQSPDLENSQIPITVQEMASDKPMTSKVFPDFEFTHSPWTKDSLCNNSGFLSYECSQNKVEILENLHTLNGSSNFPDDPIANINIAAIDGKW